MVLRCRACFDSTNPHSSRTLGEIDPAYPMLTVGDKLKACVNTIKLNTPTSKDVICWKCASLLDQFYEFRQQCIETNKHFDRTIGSPISIESDEELLDEINMLLDEVIQNSPKMQLLQQDRTINSLDMTTPSGDHAEDTREDNEPRQLQTQPVKTVSNGNASNVLPEKEVTVKRIKLDRETLRNLKMEGDSSVKAKEESATVCPVKTEEAKQLSPLTIANVTSLAKPSEKPGGPAKVHFCTLCYETFANSLALHLHRRGHQEDNYYVCTMCDFKGESTDELKTHVSKDHCHPSQKVTVLVRCKICNATFATREECKEHRRSHTKPTNTAVLSAVVGASTAATSATIKSEVPVEAAQGVKPKVAEPKQPKSALTSVGPSDRFPRQCDFCYITLASKAGMVSHMRKHKVENAFLCMMCDFKTDHAAELGVHFKLHNKSTKNIKRKPTINVQSAPANTNSNSNPNFKTTCRPCGLKFTKQSDYMSHIVVHRKNPSNSTQVP